MAKKTVDDDDDDGVEKNDGGGAEKAAAMVMWTGRVAFFLSCCAFAVMFLVSYDFTNYDSSKVIAIAVIKGACAGLLFWVAGLIIGNIILKGLITDVPVDQTHLVDGGLLQRIYLYQQRLNYDQDGNVIQIDPRTNTIARKNVNKDNKQ